MAFEITMAFIDTAGLAVDEPGYQFADYFTADGYDRAKQADSELSARRILADTYKGADTEGVAVKWNITAT